MLVVKMTVLYDLLKKAERFLGTLLFIEENRRIPYTFITKSYLRKQKHFI